MSIINRLQKELNELNTEYYSIIQTNNKMNWIIKIKHKNKIYETHILFSNKYPYYAPIIKFNNIINHPKISNDGNINIDILNKNWMPITKLNQIYKLIFDLLDEIN